MVSYRRLGFLDRGAHIGTLVVKDCGSILVAAGFRRPVQLAIIKFRPFASSTVLFRLDLLLA